MASSWVWLTDIWGSEIAKMCQLLSLYWFTFQPCPSEHTQIELWQSYVLRLLWFHGRKVKVMVEAEVWQWKLGESQSCSSSWVKDVYWAKICPNSLGANGWMKGSAQPHTYAWLWHCELWGLVQKTMTNYVCRLSYQKICWAQGGNDRPHSCPSPSLSLFVCSPSGLGSALLPYFNFPSGSLLLSVWLSS